MRSASMSTSWPGGPARSEVGPPTCGRAGKPSANVTRAAVAALRRTLMTRGAPASGPGGERHGQDRPGLLELVVGVLAQLDAHVGATGHGKGHHPLDWPAEEARVECAAVVGERNARAGQVQKERVVVAAGDAVLQRLIAVHDHLAERPGAEADAGDRAAGRLGNRHRALARSGAAGARRLGGGAGLLGERFGGGALRGATGGAALGGGGVGGDANGDGPFGGGARLLLRRALGGELRRFSLGG